LEDAAFERLVGAVIWIVSPVSTILIRFVCGFLAARADRRDLERRERTQGRNVGVSPAQPLRTFAPMMPTRIFSVVMMFFP